MLERGIEDGVLGPNLAAVELGFRRPSRPCFGATKKSTGQARQAMPHFTTASLGASMLDSGGP